MELFLKKTEYGLTTYHVGANGAYYVTYSENLESVLHDLMMSEELFVPAPNFWGDVFKQELITAAKNFPEAAELVLYHRYMDEEDLEIAAWLLLRSDIKDRTEFYKSYLAAYGAKSIYEIVASAPDKLIKILANIVRKL